MPIYQYYCTKCGFEKEINLPMADRDHPGLCPFCGNLLTRKWGVGGVVIR